MAKMRVLELYSGIGGFHYAMEESGIPHTVVAAADINNVANDIYHHNFPHTKILQRSIESITVKELDVLSPDLIHMSPPCQPFVRVGKQQDASDKRTKSFLHLIEVIPRMKKQPSYIFMENVKGFDTSETRNAVLTMLRDSGYSCQEFLLSPLQFGIPNSRLRYYLLAKLKPLTFGFDTTSKILEDVPPCASPYMVNLINHDQESQGGCHDDSNEGCYHGNQDNQTHSHHSTSDSSVISPTTNQSDCKPEDDPTTSSCCESQETSENKTDSLHVCSKTKEDKLGKLITSQETDPEAVSLSSVDSATVGGNSSLPLYEQYKDRCRHLHEFLETSCSPETLESFMIPPKFLQRFWVMDIVRASDRNSCCFTKRYGHHIEGAGSVIQTKENSTVDLSQYKRDRVYTREVEQGVASLGLRFFTPREIANLMNFPAKLEFPPDVSTIQCYRVLGNSLNVHVVAVLLRILTLGDR